MMRQVEVPELGFCSRGTCIQNTLTGEGSAAETREMGMLILGKACPLDTRGRITATQSEVIIYQCMLYIYRISDVLISLD